MSDATAPLSGNKKRQMRSAARLYAVQALFQMEHSDLDVDAVYAEFLEHRFGAEWDDDSEMVDGDMDLFRDLLNGAVDEQRPIDQMTDRALVAKWRIDRIDPTIRALFRAAGAEILGGNTPPRVVISEFVDIAKSFFPEGKEASFVNAVLDHMAREAKPEAF